MAEVIEDQTPTDMGSMLSRSLATEVLKRRASASFDSSEEGEGCRKRWKESVEDHRESRAIDGAFLADHLSRELQCGCCSELVYLPVVVNPCQHFFCGR
jgi:E3 ubiquitin-protein ligase CHFR